MPPLHARVEPHFLALSGPDGSRFWRRLAGAAGAARLHDVSLAPFEEAAHKVNALGVHVPPPPPPSLSPY